MSILSSRPAGLSKEAQSPAAGAGKAVAATHHAFYRGDHASFLATDPDLEREDAFSEFVMKGLAPPTPFITKQTAVLGFGSCFAGHIQHYLHRRGYNVASRNKWHSYVIHMSEGFVNSYSIRQQFEWAFENKVPAVSLWHDKSSEAVAYDEQVRVQTRTLFEATEVFIITLGLSEVWYDEPTGEVFWRAVPTKLYDPARHKFRLTTPEENLDNLHRIHTLIRTNNPKASIVFTLSPVPLTATFRPLGCAIASSVSKAILRTAIDSFMTEVGSADDRVFYFPSYEVVLDFFNNSFMEDRRHVHGHVLDFNMKLFERYFCASGPTDADIARTYRRAHALDQRVGTFGHWSVHRRPNPLHGRKRERPPLLVRVVKLAERIKSGFRSG